MTKATAVAPATKGSPVRRTIGILVGLGLAIGLLVWGLPFFAKTSWTDVWHVVQHIPFSHAVGYQALMVVGLYCYTFTITGAMPGLSHPRALILNVCGSSVGNLLPGGGAAGLAATYTICRSWGFDARRVSTMAIVTGVWNVLSRIALPVIAIFALYIGNTGLPAALTDLAFAALVSGLGLLGVFVAILASERAATVIGRLLDRLLAPILKRRKRTRSTSIDVLVRELRHQINDTVGAHWFSLTAGLVGFFGVYYLLFVLIARDTGVTLPLGKLFAVYAIGRLLTAVGITPGGIGVTEATTATVLVGWGAMPSAATATVLLFTVFTHLMEVPLGGLGWLAWTVMPKASAEETAAVEAEGR
ncbi:MAG: lysylphosphatidylglycerol synthase transmembrane domain-containing protein [Nostocoides sp.]